MAVLGLVGRPATFAALLAGREVDPTPVPAGPGRSSCHEERATSGAVSARFRAGPAIVRGRICDATAYTIQLLHSDATFQSSALVWTDTGPIDADGISCETTSWI
jgi:hypothetical protein